MTSFAQLKTLPHLYVVSVVFTATCVLNEFFYVLFLGFFFFCEMHLLICLVYIKALNCTRFEDFM